MSMDDVGFLDIAWIISRYGTCNRLQVGAVLVKDRRIVSQGYNGTPSGLPHCEHILTPSLANVACEEAVHAEVNAIAFAARHGTATEGATLYSTHLPCLKCSQLIINAGIVKVVYANGYRSSEGKYLLEAVRIPVIQVLRSQLQAMSITSGDEPDLYPSQPSHEAAEETADSPS